MEHDIIEKSKTNLTKAVDSELFERFNTLSKNINVKFNDGNINQQSKTLATGVGLQSNDVNNILQEGLVLMGKLCSYQRVDTIFQEKMKESIGFIPSHTIRMINASQKEKAKSSKFIINAKVNDNQYIEVVLNSPLGSILRQAQLILFTSILLVILIGIILVYQLKSMLREKQFVNFIQEY
ncbi:MAG: hypothetical protein M0P26_07410, partial [Bacteroidales bacterium]|nr:hypothetical protein [Bacteroidales bacterium]